MFKKQKSHKTLGLRSGNYLINICFHLLSVCYLQMFASKPGKLSIYSSQDDFFPTWHKDPGPCEQNKTTSCLSTLWCCLISLPIFFQPGFS